MPRFDKTGPEGKGPKTGRILGKCNEKKNAESSVNWPNWFSRRRAGRSWGIWNRNWHSENKDTE